MQPYLTCCCQSGDIWIGGGFTHADNVQCHAGAILIDSDGTGFVNPASGGGTVWGMNGTVLTFTKHQGAVWAGGGFTNVQPSGGPPITPSQPRNVVKYIPPTQQFGGGWQGYAFSGASHLSLASNGALLYSGGNAAGSPGISRVMVWNGQDWDIVDGVPVSAPVTVHAFDGLIFAHRGNAVPLSPPHVAYYNGLTWTVVDDGIPPFSSLSQFIEWSGALHLSTANKVLRFNGSGWTDMSNGLPPNAGTNYMCVHSGVLHVSASDGTVYLYDGASWMQVSGSNNASGPIASARGQLWWTNGFGRVSRFSGGVTSLVGNLSGAQQGFQATTRTMFAA